MTETVAYASGAGRRAPHAGLPAVNLARFEVLVVPGLHDSGPGHWQTRWVEEHRRFRRVVQDDWETPTLNPWAAAVARAIDRCASPPLVVAHSFGCLATLRATHLFERRIAGALLAAPADPDKFGVLAQLPSRRLPYPTILVGTNNDPWLKLTKAGLLAKRWGSEFVGLYNAGHLNAESGHGPWPEGYRLLRRLAALATPNPQQVHDGGIFDRITAR